MFTKKDEILEAHKAISNLSLPYPEMTLTGIEVESDITISPHYYHVTSVTRRDHYLLGL